MSNEVKEPKRHPIEVLSAEIEREKSQAELHKVLNNMERKEAFLKDTNALMCIECHMPCYEEITTVQRRAYSLGNGTVICNECLCPGNEVDDEEEI